MGALDRAGHIFIFKISCVSVIRLVLVNMRRNDWGIDYIILSTPGTLMRGTVALIALGVNIYVSLRACCCIGLTLYLSAVPIRVAYPSSSESLSEYRAWLCLFEILLAVLVFAFSVLASWSLSRCNILVMSALLSLCDMATSGHLLDQCLSSDVK